MSSGRKRNNLPEENDDGTTAATATPKKKKGKAGRLCSVSGCTRQVQQGGVCCRHGAKTTRASCSHEGCSNVAKRGGLCRRHGAFKLETCRKDGCKRVAREGFEFCDTHGAKLTAEGGVCSEDSSKKVGSERITSSRSSSREGCTDEVEKGVEVHHQHGEGYVGNDAIHGHDPVLQQGNRRTPAAATLQEPMLNHEVFADPVTEGGDFLCDYYEDLYEQLSLEAV